MTRGEKASAKRDQLEARFREIRRLNLVAPKKGWLKSIRESLGLTGVQMARRLRVTPAAVAQLENSEANKTISLATLESTARTLGCTLAYVIIPNENLHETMRHRAGQLVGRSKKRVAHTMDLEGQRTKSTKHSVRDSLEESYLILKLSREFWDDDKLV